MRSIRPSTVTLGATLLSVVSAATHGTGWTTNEIPRSFFPITLEPHHPALRFSAGWEQRWNESSLSNGTAVPVGVGRGTMRTTSAGASLEVSNLGDGWGLFGTVEDGTTISLSLDGEAANVGPPAVDGDCIAVARNWNGSHESANLTVTSGGMEVSLVHAYTLFQSFLPRNPWESTRVTSQDTGMLTLNAKLLNSTGEWKIETTDPRLQQRAPTAFGSPGATMTIYVPATSTIIAISGLTSLEDTPYTVRIVPPPPLGPDTTHLNTHRSYLNWGTSFFAALDPLVDYEVVIEVDREAQAPLGLMNFNWVTANFSGVDISTLKTQATTTTVASSTSASIAQTGEGMKAGAGTRTASTSATRTAGGSTDAHTLDKDSEAARAYVNIGAVIGGVFAGIVIFVILAALLFCIYRRRDRPPPPVAREWRVNLFSAARAVQPYVPAASTARSSKQSEGTSPSPTVPPPRASLYELEHILTNRTESDFHVIPPRPPSPVASSSIGAFRQTGEAFVTNDTTHTKSEVDFGRLVQMVPPPYNPGWKDDTPELVRKLKW